MNPIRLDLSSAEPFYTPEEWDGITEEAVWAADVLRQGTGAGSDFLGWLDLPETYDREEVSRILNAADDIRGRGDILVVVGIGGSYLGARAANEFLGSPFSLLTAGTDAAHPTVLYAGNQLSGSYLSDLLALLETRDFSVNVISKSGTTTEPAIAFRLLKGLLEKKYGKEGAAARIYATTDKKRGALKTLADTEGYETFVVPDDIGGRFSVLTAVGLLPIAAAGWDIEALLGGAAAERAALRCPAAEDNEAMRYACARNLLYRKGRSVEVFASYEPPFHYVAEWWKQLYGESEGKEGKGLYPSSVDLTTDLHSMGQFLQEGSRIMFETVVTLDEPGPAPVITEEAQDLDGLNYLAGKDLNFVNDCARRGTLRAHIDGGVPNLLVRMPRRDEASLGALFYFFEYACGVSGYLLGVNPFDQPGVEAYKKNMFTLLGKPGYTV